MHPEKTRLLILSHEDPANARGGLGVVVGELCREFSALGIEVTLVTGTENSGIHEGRAQSAEPALDPYSLPSVKERGPALTHFAERALAAAEVIRPAAIYAHDWVALDAGLRLRERLGVRLVAHVHSTEWDRSLGRVDPWILEREGAGLRAADRVLCVSAATRAKLVTRYGVDPARTAVLHPGIPRSQQELSQTALPQGELAASSAEMAAPNVLFLGRLVPQKGLDLFLRAAVLIRAELPQARFLVAGEGPSFHLALERAIDLGLGSCLRFTGHLTRPDVSQLLSRAGALLIPSLAEPYGLVGLEAAGAGVPVIASRACGFAEALPPFRTFEPLDAQAAAEGVIAALQDPSEVRQWRTQAQVALARLRSEAVAALVLAEVLPPGSLSAGSPPTGSLS